MTTPQRPRARINPSPELAARLERTWATRRRGAKLPPQSVPNVAPTIASNEEADDGS